MYSKVLVVVASLTIPLFLWAKSYALVVGIDRYNEADNLNGAVADAVSLNKMLIDQGIESITLLKNSEATRDNVLYTLQKIAKEIQKDDQFYMFFSGHGTSLQDASFAETFRGDKKLLAMMENSGALIPSDFSRKNVRDTLIIGYRDLRPQFEKIDTKGATSLVVFDACFSGMTSRSLPSRKSRRRHLILPNEIHYDTTSKDSKKRVLLSLNKIYFTPKLDHPYKNLIYIASTSTSDWAVENKNTRRGYLTQQVEQCLKGIGDYNRDQRIFKKELDGCLKNSNLPQAPQVYPQDESVDPFIIGYSNVIETQNTLNINSSSGVYTISDNYSQLQQFDNLSDVERFKKSYSIFEIEGSDSFNMVAYESSDLDIAKKTFAKGDNLIITMRSKKGGYLALFSIDSRGHFYILEPYEESKKIHSEMTYRYAESEVGEPLGTDLMKGILFYNKKDLDKLRAFHTDSYGRVRDIDEVEKIYHYLKKLPKSSFETASLKLFTQK